MRLPYVIFTLAMLASVSTAQAIPNMWTSGFGMGVTEYIITSPEKVVFNLNCTGNPDAHNILQHGVDLTLPDGTSVSSHDDGTEITVVIDNLHPSAGGMAIMPGCHLLTHWGRQQISMFMSAIKK